MRTIGLFEAKQKLSELVQRSGDGEEIGITVRGELVARLLPARREMSWAEIFAALKNVRGSARLRRGVTIRQLIREGRV